MISLGRILQSRAQRWAVGVTCALAVWGMAPAGMAQTSPPPDIAQELQAFRQMGTVLYIAAHPDDENTELIAWFARGRDCRTGYLSFTRGHGGQHVIGAEVGDE